MDPGWQLVRQAVKRLASTQWRVPMPLAGLLRPKGFEPVVLPGAPGRPAPILWRLQFLVVYATEDPGRYLPGLHMKSGLGAEKLW